MATLTYVPKNGDPLLDAEKITNLRIQNEINRTKLAKLNGDLVDRKEVTFVIETALVILRTKILQLPKLIVADLHGRLELAQLHGIRQHVEQQVDRALNEVVDDLERSLINQKEFLGELAGEDTEGEEAKADRARKEAAAKAERTRKRHEKAGK